MLDKIIGANVGAARKLVCEQPDSLISNNIKDAIIENLIDCLDKYDIMIFSNDKWYTVHHIERDYRYCAVMYCSQGESYRKNDAIRIINKSTENVDNIILSHPKNPVSLMFIFSLKNCGFNVNPLHHNILEIYYGGMTGSTEPCIEIQIPTSKITVPKRFDYLFDMILRLVYCVLNDFDIFVIDFSRLNPNSVNHIFKRIVSAINHRRVIKILNDTKNVNSLQTVVYA